MTTCNNGACPCPIPRTYLTDCSDAYRTAQRQELRLAPRGEIPPHVQHSLDAQFHQTFDALTETRPTCLTCHHYIEDHADPQPRVLPAVVPPLPLSAKALQGLEALGRQVQRTSWSHDTQVNAGGTEQPSSHICQKCQVTKPADRFASCPHRKHVCYECLHMCVRIGHDDTHPCPL